MRRLNRRQLTQTLVTGAATAAGASLHAQGSPAQPPADDLLAAAKRQVGSNRAILDKIAIPMATEPASAFRAS